MFYVLKNNEYQLLIQLRLLYKQWPMSSSSEIIDFSRLVYKFVPKKHRKILEHVSFSDKSIIISN